MLPSEVPSVVAVLVRKRRIQRFNGTSVVYTVQLKNLLSYCHTQNSSTCIDEKYRVLFILFIFKCILIHPSKTTLPCCVLYKENYSLQLYCGDGGMPTSFGTGGRCYSTDSHTSFQLRGRLLRPHRCTTRRMTRPSSFAAGSRVHTLLQ